MSNVRLEVEERIAAPIGQVFERLTDLDGYAEWVGEGGVFRGSTKLSRGPVGLGTTYVDRTLLGTLEGWVIRYERPTRVVFHQQLVWWRRLVMDGRISYELRPVPGGTAVRHVAEPHLYGPAKLLAPLLRLRGSGERRRILAGLKQSLETPAAVCPWPIRDAAERGSDGDDARRAA